MHNPHDNSIKNVIANMGTVYYVLIGVFLADDLFTLLKLAFTPNGDNLGSFIASLLATILITSLMYAHTLRRMSKAAHRDNK